MKKFPEEKERIESLLDGGHAPHSRLHIRVTEEATALERSILKNDLQNRLGQINMYVYDSAFTTSIMKERMSTMQIFNFIIAIVVFILALF